MFFFSRGYQTSTCLLGWELNTLILVSFTFEKSSILQCSPHCNHQQKHYTLDLYLSVPELENSVFLDLVLLSCTPVATLHSYTVKYMFLTFSTQWNSIGWRNWRWKVVLESLFTFTLLVFRTKQGAWHKRIQLGKGFHFISTRTINSVQLILGSQYSLCEN